MLRLIAVVSASVLATASCTSNEPKHTAAQGSAGPASAAAPPAAAPEAPAPAPPAAPASVLELVQRWAPQGSQVAPAELTVPGLALFTVTDAKPAGDGEYSGGALVGVAGGVGGKILEGRELVQAASAGKPDRKVLAQVAMRVAQRDGEGDLLDRATSAEQRKAKVTAPTIKGGTLVFWVSTTQPPRSLERGKLDLATGRFELEPVTASHGAAIDDAIAVLAGGVVSRYPSAIDTLVAACAEPKPRQVLLSMLSRHPRDRTRIAIGNALRKCGPVAVDPLINQMEHDPSAMVRAEAAGALGRTGDSRARAALAKAARSDDANLAWAAKNALGKLK